MDYTINKLARLAGISTRTLRYYDEIGLLRPPRMNSSGYRYYGQAEVNKLQQIMFYRELGFKLHTIGKILEAPDFNRAAALAEHREQLLVKKQQLEVLIANVEKTMAAQEGRCNMSDREKFEGFKQKLIDDNESEHGQEIREKYGEEAVESSYRKLKSMSAAQYAAFEKLTEQVNEADPYQCSYCGNHLRRFPYDHGAHPAGDFHGQPRRLIGNVYRRRRYYPANGAVLKKPSVFALVV
jgi:DNA-binding transcriptional MerR regulator